MVSKHDSPLGLDGKCDGHAYISVAYVFLMLMVYVLIVYAWWWSWLQLCRHVNVDGVVLGCGCHECMLVMHWLCMLVLICCYTYIDMVIVVVNKVMVCGRYGHALIVG